MPLPPLASPDDALTLGYDVTLVSKYLYRASARVRGHLRGRVSAAGLFADPPVVPHELREIVVAIAARMASVSPQVAKGVQAESLNGGGVTWGSDAFRGLTGLTDSEKSTLDRMFRTTPGTIHTDPQ